MKDEVPLLPLVKVIAEHVRPHGPKTLGFRGFSLLMPAAMRRWLGG